jgi:hypothetical protein
MVAGIREQEQSRQPDGVVRLIGHWRTLDSTTAPRAGRAGHVCDQDIQPCLGIKTLPWPPCRYTKGFIHSLMRLSSVELLESDNAQCRAERRT